MRRILAFTLPIAVLVAGSLVTGPRAAGAQAAATSGPDGWPRVASEPYAYSPPGVDDPLRFAIFRDFLPWGSSRDDDLLTANGIAFTVFGSASMGAIDLSVFDKVILSNQQASSFAAAVEAHRGWFESYVAGGGCLLSGMAHFFPDFPVGATYPGDYEYAAQHCNDAVSIELGAHPVFHLPNPIPPEQLAGWDCSTHGPLTPPPGSVTLLRDDDLDQGPALCELGLGAGFILTTTMPYQVDRAPAAFAENLLLYRPCATTPVTPITWGRIKSTHRD